MTDLPPHLYRRQGLEQGVAEPVLERAAARRRLLRERGSYPVLTLRHLAQLTGASYGYLRSIVDRSNDPYTDISLQKRRGGRRPISAPEPFLMDVQRWMLDTLLATVPVHSASFAYRRNHSIKDCAEEHVGARWLLKFDLHDFFGTIDERRVYRIYRHLGYSQLLSFEMTRISTRLLTARTPKAWNPPREHVIPSYTVGGIGVLPQGAPTSGLLANAVAHDLDQQLSALAVQRGLAYTRYSDDLTFSTPSRTFSRSAAGSVIDEVGRIVRRNRFVLHEKKTRVVPPGARHLVLGLLVLDDAVRLTPEFRARIKNHIRGARTFGVSRHSETVGFASPLTFVEYLDGCIAFAKGVEADFAARAEAGWLETLRENRFPRLES